MWLRVTIRNWRSIDQAMVELSPFTIIVGRNSSGKSNFVDALKFVEEVASDAATAVTKRGGITSIRRWAPSRPYDITLKVRSAATKEALDTSFSEHEMVLGSGKAGEWFFKRERVEVRGRKDGGVIERSAEHEVSVEEGQLIFPELHEAISLSPNVSVMVLARQLIAPVRGRRTAPLPRVRLIRPAPEEMRKPQPPSESPVLTDDGRNVATTIDRMTPPERDALVLAMRKIVPGLENIEADHVGRYLSLSFQQRHAAGSSAAADFAATEMSEGALRALAVVLAARQAKRDDVLMVEEPEVNLHPGAAGVVYDVLREASKETTVVVTTHSPELLDHASEADILVCEYLEGVTKIGPLAMKQRALVRDGLFTVAELMRADDLRREGAKPRTVVD